VNTDKTQLEKVLNQMRGKEFDDPRLDRDGMFAARDICYDFADQICEALKEPNTVFEILKQFHDAHYSVFPRDELTEWLCHAFYDQFVEKPEGGEN
jgi:hypothetical protein